MTRSRCAMVISIPRAGSSCVAGALHRLGVDMGTGHFQGKDKANPRGYYEDLQWRYANQRVTGRGYDAERAVKVKPGKKQKQIWRELAAQYKSKSLWGMKDPWLCFVGRHVWKALREEDVNVRAVFVRRDFEASCASICKHIQKSYRGKYRMKPSEIASTWLWAFEQRRAEWDGESLDVWYEELLADPDAEIRRMAGFCYAGLEIPIPGISDAVKWVSPALQHFKGGR